MNTTPNLYIDGIGQIHITDGLVRIDLMALEPHLKAENGQPVFAVTQRLVLSMDNFLQAFNLQEALIQKLVQDGVAKRTPQQDTALPEDPLTVEA